MKKDIIGKRFGRLFVDRYKGDSGRDKYWVVCKCDCGNEKTVYLYSITTGYTKSCGCLNSEMARERFKTHGFACEDKASRPREYGIWMNMRRRCNDPGDFAFKDYGGRGIKIAEAWNDFSVFFADVGVSPPGTTLDRIDNNKGYSKENCRWTTVLEQQRNKRNNVNLTLGGVTMCASQWAEVTGIPHKRILRRVRYGWPVERILSAAKGGGRGDLGL